MAREADLTFGLPFLPGVCNSRLVVTIAWCMHKPLTMLFDALESIVLLLSGTYHTLPYPHVRSPSRSASAIVVNYTVQDGKSNWMEGVILLSLYIMLAVVFWYYPGQSWTSPGFARSDASSTQS